MQCKEKACDHFFWKSDICIYNGDIITPSWIWSLFFIICCAEKRSDAIILLKSWKQSKKMLKQYNAPLSLRQQDNTGLYIFTYNAWHCAALRLSHITLMLLCSTLEEDRGVKMW